MEKEKFSNLFDEKKEKTVKDYCNDIINACSYDLSKLLELKVIKTEYDENNNITWYIAGSEQAYTNYRELRKGLEAYVLHLDNGKIFSEEEFFETLGNLISKEIPTLLLSTKTSLQMTCKLMSRILSQVKETKLSYFGMITGRFSYEERLLETQWDLIEKRLRILSDSPLYINDIIEHSIDNYRLSEATIRNKNIKNVFIDSHPSEDERSKIISWGVNIGINVFFTELGAIDSFNSKQVKSGSEIFSRPYCSIHFN